jgi:uncharacterized RDD family membrane protein YckC
MRVGICAPMAERRPDRRPSLAARLVGGGLRSAQAVAGATGVDEAVELATEEAIVRALESPAVERALIRVLEGPAVEDALQRVLASPAVERALIEALDSELVDTVWERLLASDEAQKLVERVAEAPEVRAAVAAQGVGLVEDLGRQVRRISHHLDGVVEAFARRITFRRRRTAPSDNAGLVTRGVALAIDAGLLNAAFVGLSALVALAASALFPDSSGPSGSALAVGGVFWFAMVGVYLMFFWTLAGQTPGMRFLGIRLEDFDGTNRLSPRTAFRRLVGIGLCVLTLGIGFLIVLFSDRRRGLHDRFANTEVILVDRNGEPESSAHRVGASDGT